MLGHDNVVVMSQMASILRVRHEAFCTLQACFRKEWAQLVEASFRNFLAEAIEQLPLPAVLRFDADRQQRLQLQEQCRSLQKQNSQLKQVRGISACKAVL